MSASADTRTTPWPSPVRWCLLLAALVLATGSVACSSAVPATPTPLQPETPASTASLSALPTPSPTPTSTPTPPPAPAEDEPATAAAQVFDRVAELVAVLGHREGGTEAERRAAEHLKGALDDMGYAAEIQPFSRSGLESRNVVADLAGETETIVIVGAHYDVDPNARAGANDNTSGTAVMLALAEALAERPLPFTLRFIAFGAEELGLYGSRHYVARLGDDAAEQVRVMVNFDTVGTGALRLASLDDQLAALAAAAVTRSGVDGQLANIPTGASSDHTPFEAAGVPTLTFFASDYSRIHTPADRLEFVQPEVLGNAFLVAKLLLESPEFAAYVAQPQPTDGPTPTPDPDVLPCCIGS